MWGPANSDRGCAVAFAVAVCGAPAARLTAYPSHASVVELPDPTEPDFLDAGADLRRTLDPDLPLVLLHTARGPAVRRARMLRALLRTHQVVPVPVLAPPTGLAARATVLADLADRGIASEHATRAVEEHAGLVSIACVSTLSGVDLPGIGMRLHAAAALPGVAAGVVTQHGEVDVAVNRLPALPAVGTPCDRVVHGNPTLAGRLPAALPPARETVDIDEVAAATRWWVRGQFHEQTLVPAVSDTLMAHALAPGTARCAGCGQASGGCPRCTNRQENVA